MVGRIVARHEMKLGKVRSIKLTRVPTSTRSYTRQSTLQSDQSPILIPSPDTKSSGQSTPFDTLGSYEASPDYMKATYTSSSHAKMDTFKKPVRILTRRSSFKTKLNKSRSIKLKNFQASKCSYKESDLSFESSHSIDDQNWETLNDLDSPVSSAVNKKLVRVLTRRLSLKPSRVQTKMSTLKTKKPSMRKQPQKNKSYSEFNILRATCSSTLKGSKPMNHIDREPEWKVCPYYYCSLHGHRHENPPPLNLFMSVKRRQLKTQKSIKPENGDRPINVGKPKTSGNRKKGVQTSKITNDPLTEIHGGPSLRSSGGGDLTIHDEEKRNLGCDFEVFFSETSNPCKTFETCLNQISDSHLEGRTCLVKNDGNANLVLNGSEAKPNHSLSEEMEVKDDKYTKMWHLMFKRALSSSSMKGEEIPSNLKDKGEERIEDGEVLTGNETSDSSTGLNENENNLELSKIEDAVKMVQQVFDEILLPEIQGRSSDDDSITRSNSVQELSPNNDNDEEGGLKEESWIGADNYKGHEEGKVEDKSGKKVLKNWSNLKKLILLKRFVKALSKVRKINQRKPHDMTSESRGEAERVALRHLMTEERKFAEEWMLDYALQKVISKLAPAQKQRVALLVEAFETIVPHLGSETGLRSPTEVVAEGNATSQSGKESGTIKEHDNFAKILLGNAQCLNRIKGYTDYACDSPNAEQLNPMKCYDVKETSDSYCCTEIDKSMHVCAAADEECARTPTFATKLEMGRNEMIHVNNFRPEINISGLYDSPSLKPDDKEGESVCDAEDHTDGEVTQYAIPNSNSEHCNNRVESKRIEFDIKNRCGTTGEQLDISKSPMLTSFVNRFNSIVSSDATCDSSDKHPMPTKEVVGTAKIGTRVVEGFPKPEESEVENSNDAMTQFQLERQDNTKLWYLVFKHMITGMATNDHSKPLEYGEEGAAEHDTDSMHGANISPSDEHKSVRNQDMHMKDHQMTSQRQMKAIRLVEEAIDAIIPNGPDQEHSRHEEPLDSVTIPENRPPRNVLNGGHEPLISRIKNNSKNKEREYLAEQGSAEYCTRSDDATTQEDKAAIREGENKRKFGKSWSNLEKVILLRRFIKSLEKIGKINPREPTYLPLEPDQEGEKVCLRHQDALERKDSDEWMLDYALQQVVAKLTPARKRKVTLLVEAFETVIPNGKP